MHEWQGTASAVDLSVVEAQLGRPLRGTWRVVRRCHLGVPMVVETYPRLEDGSPFPTLFWLTCPLLVRRASHLEAQGYMGVFTERLQRDQGAHERLQGAVDRYTARRDGHEIVEGAQPGGGPDRVKCLHAHLAQELADPPNPVGAMALAQTGWPDCLLPCAVAK
ncbi:MAG: DUF501 domain-containing protein [Actinomycetota bacterium]